MKTSDAVGMLLKAKGHYTVLSIAPDNLCTKPLD